MADEPLYQRVKRELVAVIESGEFPPDVPFVTQRKICEQFGVSHATAVRALNDLVAEGYVIRRRGQGTFVAPRRPSAGDGSVACVLQFHGPHVSGLLAGIESVCDELGYRLYLNHCDGDPEHEQRVLLAALDHGVSGIIAYPAQGSSAGRGYTEALRRGVPLVLVDRYRPDIATDAVLADNFAAGRELTEELIASGHNVIATLWEETDVTSVRDRLAGHVEALRHHGLPIRPDLTVLLPHSSLPEAERRAKLSGLLRGPGRRRCCCAPTGTCWRARHRTWSRSGWTFPATWTWRGWTTRARSTCSRSRSPLSRCRRARWASAPCAYCTSASPRLPPHRSGSSCP